MQHSSQGFGISPYMQELMVYAGHLNCYAQCNEILEHYLNIPVSSSQVYRVTDYISERLKQEDNSEERLLPPVSNQDVLYVELDGSMISTREEGWKEVKLGRMFKSSDCLNPNSNSSMIAASQYVGHFGNSEDFCSKLENTINSYGRLHERLVFITDGATWIKRWIEDTYPNAGSLLDYFHVCEHLHKFADTICFETPKSKEVWCERQKELLLDSQTEKVMENVLLTSGEEKDKQDLINYYQNNIKRMDYKKYRQTGCGIIGSGAIESAHRTVIQKRMKLSGQHWSRAGAQNMLRLRIISMNKQWHKVIDVIKNNESRAA